MEEIFKMIGITVFLFLVGYVILKTLNFQFNFLNSSLKEGLTTSSTPLNINGGYAGNALSFSENIKSKNTEITDKLIITKYRRDYENIIINMEDYISLLMLEITLNLDMTNKTEEIIKTLNNLGTLKLSKDALNDMMKYLDGIK